MAAAATRRGLSPAVPRIPIVIELREYAQWFGGRGKDEPKGILTYLAEKISRAVEIPVLAGTLRRAIGTRSWLAVFDGLDEVPHDVKDELAKEVHHFVDDVAVEMNADLFTLCTSRPQGYAGQFAELEAPTVRLAELSAEQALDFAAPVLSLDRSESDAQKSVEILKAAIQSSSVRELMKSPLQAHIMAVVVRDGGRPPERRWHLFTNFYQVIRRREGNRELADPRLSKLLREEEQLVKTVHSRLGFVLHANAETSEGAVTRLGRSGFRNLVEQAVAQMLDTDIDKTVDVLMDATTERLVLVNTPDDGNHVRFDIRPLQEFFAAEFLYEGLEAGELGPRLETVLGDAHWREVMHFLLSALIESGRRTELSVAIKVLEGLDRGEVEEIERLPAKRMARGALLGMRLLSEGVLEQDKRHREQFRNVFSGLCGLTEPAELILDSNENHEQSREWFINFLFDSLSESSFSENVGAAVLLTHLLVDDHPRIDEFTRFLLNAPRHYLSYVLAARVRNIYFREMEIRRVHSIARPNQKWLVRFALGVLDKSHWHEVGAQALDALIRLVSDSLELSSEAARSEGATEIDIQLVNEVFRRRDFQSELRWGFVDILTYAEDWTTGIDPERVPALTPLLEKPATGLFRLAQMLLRFGVSRSFADFEKVRAEFANIDEDVIAVLPNSIRAFLPGTSSRHEPSKAALDALDEQGFEHLYATITLEPTLAVRPGINVISEELPDYQTLEEAWQSTAEFSPESALGLISARYGPGDPPAHVVSYVIDRIIDEPQIALAGQHAWGWLVHNSGEREEGLRRALTEAAESERPRAGGWPQHVEPFPLQLPFEAPLIPHIAAAMLGGMHPYRSPAHVDDINSVDLGSTMAIFFPDLDSLQKILRDVAMSNRLRGGAMLCLAMHPGVDDPLTLVGECAADFYCGEEAWYIGALLEYLRLWAPWRHQCTQRLLTQLIDLTRDDYPAREIIQRVLSVWREASTAPVTAKNLVESWLATD